jgi:hypothetical protein
VDECKPLATGRLPQARLFRKGGQAHTFQVGDYTRPLLSSTSAVSDTLNIPKPPKHPLHPRHRHRLNNPYIILVTPKALTLS